MADSSDPDKNNEGKIKTESGPVSKLVEMVEKMKENFARITTVSVKEQPDYPATTSTSEAGTRESLANNNNQEILPKECEDSESKKGKFSWQLIDGYYVPYIIRIINGEYLKLVSVRMAETHLLRKYLYYLHSDVYKCISVKSHFISNSEAMLLNDINRNHADREYGIERFVAGKDFIVSLDDVQEFYAFIVECYNKLLSNITPGQNNRCGFIRIDSDSVVPYSTQDGQKYVPLFYFEGETQILLPRVVHLTNWSLAYLKFCCKVQGIRDELFANDSYAMVSLDYVKTCYSTDTEFEDYWPTKLIDTQLLTNQSSNHNNTQVGTWFKAPLEVPAPVIPQTISVIENTYQNGLPANQTINSNTTQSQPQPLSTHRGDCIPTRNQSKPVQSSNTGSTTSRGTVHVIRPPPLVADTAPVTNQYMITMYDPMNNSYAISQPMEIQQIYTQRNNNQSQGQHRQRQLHQQQQQNSTTSQNRQTYRGQFSNGRLTNTFRNFGKNFTPPAIETIDLSSPSSSSVPTTAQENTVRPKFGWKLTMIPERTWANDTINNSAAYKIQKATLQGKIIHCINAKPYIYSDLMVTLNDLVKIVMPSCTIAKCVYVLTVHLNTTLYKGNSEQMAVLRENGRLWSMCPNETPMAMLQHITQILPQLQTLIHKKDIKIQQPASGPIKREQPN